PPEGPTIAIVSPLVTSAVTSRSTSSLPWRLESLRTLIMRQPPLEPARELRQRKAQRQIERRAGHAWNQPAAHVDRSDRHPLCQLDHRDRADERRVFEHRDEIVCHRWQREAQRLRDQHEPQDLTGPHAECLGSFGLTAWNREQRSAIDLGLVG